MSFLLDVNVLIGLIDATHIWHGPAHRWFKAEGAAAWATCPLTENGVIRIVSHSKYPNNPGSPARVCEAMASFREQPGHRFWADDLSLLADERIDPAKILTSAQVTDSYLLALAVKNGARLATFDRRLSASAVRGGKDALYVIGMP